MSNEANLRALGSVTRRNALGALGAGAAAAAFPSIAFAQSRTITLGYVSPETGPLAEFGAADNYVIGAMRKHFANGISLGGKRYPLNVVVKDSQSSSNRAGEVASELILKDKADLVLVSSTPETTNPVSDQCELNGVPCIATVAPWQPWFFTRHGDPKKGFDWTYLFFWGLEDLIPIYMGMWNQISTNKTVGGLFPNDGDGNAWGDAKLGFPNYIVPKGFKMVDPGRYQDLTSDFSAQVNAYKKAEAQILTGVPIPPDFKTFWTQAAQQGYKPKVATIGKALLFPSAIEALGDNGFGLASEVWWSPSHPFRSSLTGQTSAELARAYESATGKQWTQPLGFAHALFEVAAAVLRRAKDVQSHASVRDAILAVDVPTIVGTVKWGAGPVKNVAKTPLVGGQWQRGKRHKYDLVIVENHEAHAIAVQGKLQPLA